MMVSTAPSITKVSRADLYSRWDFFSPPEGVALDDHTQEIVSIRQFYKLACLKTVSPAPTQQELSVVKDIVNKWPKGLTPEQNEELWQQRRNPDATTASSSSTSSTSILAQEISLRLDRVQRLKSCEELQVLSVSFLAAVGDLYAALLIQPPLAIYLLRTPHGTWRSNVQSRVDTALRRLFNLKPKQWAEAVAAAQPCPVLLEQLGAAQGLRAETNVFVIVQRLRTDDTAVQAFVADVCADRLMDADAWLRDEALISDVRTFLESKAGKASRSGKQSAPQGQGGQFDQQGGFDQAVWAWLEQQRRATEQQQRADAKARVREERRAREEAEERKRLEEANAQRQRQEDEKRRQVEEQRQQEEQQRQEQRQREKAEARQRQLLQQKQQWRGRMNTQLHLVRADAEHEAQSRPSIVCCTLQQHAALLMFWRALRASGYDFKMMDDTVFGWNKVVAERYLLTVFKQVHDQCFGFTEQTINNASIALGCLQLNDGNKKAQFPFRVVAIDEEPQPDRKSPSDPEPDRTEADRSSLSPLAKRQKTHPILRKQYLDYAKDHYYDLEGRTSQNNHRDQSPWQLEWGDWNRVGLLKELWDAAHVHVRPSQQDLLVLLREIYAPHPFTTRTRNDDQEEVLLPSLEDANRARIAWEEKEDE